MKYFINKDFDIEQLVKDKKYGFIKSDKNKYKFSDITVPIFIDVETREMILPMCIGVVSEIYQNMVVDKLLEMNIVIKENN